MKKLADNLAAAGALLPGCCLPTCLPAACLPACLLLLLSGRCLAAAWLLPGRCLTAACCCWLDRSPRCIPLVPATARINLTGLAPLTLCRRIAAAAARALAGTPLAVEHYLVLFLKFIASVVPTIQYDYTMSVGGG